MGLIGRRRSLITREYVLPVLPCRYQLFMALFNGSTLLQNVGLRCSQLPAWPGIACCLELWPASPWEVPTNARTADRAAPTAPKNLADRLHPVHDLPLPHHCRGDRQPEEQAGGGGEGAPQCGRVVVRRARHSNGTAPPWWPAQAPNLHTPPSGPPPALRRSTCSAPSTSCSTWWPSPASPSGTPGRQRGGSVAACSCRGLRLGQADRSHPQTCPPPANCRCPVLLYLHTLHTLCQHTAPALALLPPPAGT